MPAVPDYIHISDSVAADIKGGRLKPGEKLPSIEEMCRKYNTSTSTLRLALVRMEALKIVVRRQGKGVYATDPKTWMRDPDLSRDILS